MISSGAEWMNASPTSVAGRVAALYVRLALATAFLSAVADRFGGWGPPDSAGVAWGDFGRFLSYTGSLVPFLPPDGVAALGWVVTIAEILLGISLLFGLRVREAAVGSAILLLGFALGMMVGDGVKAPFDASVFSASAGALLLYAHPKSFWSLDAVFLSRSG